MKIIVLSKTEYKEQDIIVNAISEEGPISFKARSALSPTNPFKWLYNPLTVAEVEFAGPQTYKYPILKRAVLISSPMKEEQDLNHLLAINIVAEATIKMLEENERRLLYKDLLAFIDAYKSKSCDLLLVLLIYIAKAIKYAGFELEVNKCVHCGSSKEIVAFSFDEGGFICKNCLNENIDVDLTPSQMYLVRFVFSAPDFTYSIRDNVTEDDKKYLLQKFNAFINDIIGVQIQSIDMILN